jgi:hypothetical protein
VTSPNAGLVGPPLLATPSTAPIPPHSRILLGILLALVGVGLEAVGFLMGYFMDNLVGPAPTLGDIIARIEIESAVEASGTAVVGVGLFLFFFSASRVRPATNPWTLAAALAVLVADLVSAVSHILFFQAWSALVSGSRIPQIEASLSTFSAIQAAAGYVGFIAMMVGLFGLARALVSS